MELKGHWENTVENWTPIYDRLPFHLLSRYGQVLLGRRHLDGRYLLMGLVANFVGIVSIFFPHLVTQGIMLPLLSVAIGISGWFTVGGFVRKVHWILGLRRDCCLEIFRSGHSVSGRFHCRLTIIIETSRFAKLNNSSAHQPCVQVHGTPST